MEFAFAATRLRAALHAKAYARRQFQGLLAVATVSATATTSALARRAADSSLELRAAIVPMATAASIAIYHVQLIFKEMYALEMDHAVTAFARVSEGSAVTAATHYAR